MQGLDDEGLNRRRPKKTEAVSQMCSVKKGFLEILQNSQGNTCARVPFLIKQHVEVCNFIKKRDSGTGVFLRILPNFQ